MQIISDLKEQVQDITFLRRLVSKTHLVLDILNLKWTCYAPKNHLGLLLGKRVIFNEHIPSKMIKYYQNSKCYQKVIIWLTPWSIVKNLSVICWTNHGLWWYYLWQYLIMKHWEIKLRVCNIRSEIQQSSWYIQGEPFWRLGIRIYK